MQVVRETFIRLSTQWSGVPPAWYRERERARDTVPSRTVQCTRKKRRVAIAASRRVQDRRRSGDRSARAGEEKKSAGDTEEERRKMKRLTFATKLEGETGTRERC